MRSLARTGFAGLVLVGLLSQASVVLAHAERQAFFPNPPTDINNPTANVRHERPNYRPLLPTPASPRLVVCKKPGNEGVETGKDSASLIAAFSNGALKSVNQQLLGECAFEHLQAAVDAVTTRGTTIYVLPGLYREQPSIRALEDDFGAAVPADKTFCQAVLARGPGKLTYEEQMRCRHIQNTVAIFGDPNYTDDNCGTDTGGVCNNPQTQICTGTCEYYDLQIEGTGAKITDVVFEGDFITEPGSQYDGRFRYLNGIRADRADGIYLRNFTTQIYEFNAVYVMETDGYVFDRLLSRWVDEYAFLSFASDHGLYDYTEGYGVADSVQYPGSGADIYPTANHATADLRKRQATEIRNSKGHHASLAYSGTAGNAPWVHHNEFYKNQTGMATESIYGGHPGMPQDHALWENNKIYSNNKDYTILIEDDGPCNGRTPRDSGVVPSEFRYMDALPADFQEAIMDRTVVCPGIPFPPGTAALIAGGNYDVIQKNEIYDNWRWGLWLVSIPTLIHKLTDNPQSPLDTAGVADPIQQNDPTGGFSTVNDALGAVTSPENRDVLTQPFFSSHYGRVLENHFGENLAGVTSLSQPNGTDIWWDNSGVGNCFVGNTSKQGEVTTDLGPLGLLGLPEECGDGDDPDLINQVTTVRPNRLADYVNCLNYTRSDASSKEGCPFFDPLVPPAGRQPLPNRVTADAPAQALAASSGAVLGYFVLHNDSSVHRVSSATVKVSGPVAALGDLQLSVKDIFSNVVTAPGTLDGDTLTFTFATPARVPLQEATLFELRRVASQSAASGMLQLAALPLGGGGAVLLLLSGLRGRQRRLLLVAALLVALAGCIGDDDDASQVTGGGGGGGGGTVRFELVGLQFADSPTDADYSGMPLVIGEVTP